MRDSIEAVSRRWASAAMFLLLALVPSCGKTAKGKAADAAPTQGPTTPQPTPEPKKAEDDKPTQKQAREQWAALTGDAGSSSQWGSGWLDLASPRDFKRGERLRLRIGGSAKKILVRLLGRGMSPDSSRGLLGGIITVPADRLVEVPIDIDRKSVIQISVHGGPNPWNKPLGQTNGPATLEAVQVARD